MTASSRIPVRRPGAAEARRGWRRVAGRSLASAAALVALLVALSVSPHAAARQMEDVEIETVPVADGIYMLVGQGGNIGVSVGDDGVILVDDQYAPLTDRIRAAIAEISDRPIRFVLNTHWHGDHTGGNENLGEAGALIVAHDNVRERMSTEQFIEFMDRRVPASPDTALPVVTFNDAVTLHLNDEEIHAFHVDPAHTDGDSIVVFRKANAVHMGDIFFRGTYPFIDLSSGGSVDGMIAAAARVLEMTEPGTPIIPGHGPLGDRADLEAYHDMLRTIRDRVAAMVEEGKSLEEVIAAAPTAEFDAAMADGFIGPEQFLGIVYESLSGH